MKLDDGREVQWFDTKRRVYCIDGVEISLVELDPDAFTQIIHPEYWAEKKQRAAALRTDAEAMDKLRREDGNSMRGDH